MFMVCLNCRKELPEDALFCPECGKPVKNGSSSSRETKSNNNAPRETDNLRSFEQASQIRCPKCEAYGCVPIIENGLVSLVGIHLGYEKMYIEV